VLCYVPVAMLGFHPVLLMLFSFGAAIQIVCHTTRFGRWGWWDHIFMSPTNHGVHHSRNPMYIDTNYGGGTVLWDRLFGTWKLLDREPMVFGVTHAVNSTNLIKVYFWEYAFLWRDLKAAPTWRARLDVLFGRPGYTFEAPQPQVAPTAVPALAAE
jgi:sterol desaturase/sphingolipid hydroxylase (fatty acid hydroxylase superfamily)